MSSGIAAAAVQLAVTELVARAMPGLGSPLSAVQRAAVDRSSAPMSDAALTLLGGYAKHLLGVGLIGGILGNGAAAGLAVPRVGAVGTGLLGITGVIGALGSLARPGAPSWATLPAAAGTAAGVLTQFALRRRGVRTAALLAGGAALAIAAARRPPAIERAEIKLRQPATLPAPRADMEFGIPGVRPLITPIEDFYVVHIAIDMPRVALPDWRLRLTGEVDHELELTYDDLLAMPMVEVYSTMVCVHNHIGGPRVSTGRWLGVPVADLLARVGVSPGADQLLAHSVTADALTSGVPLDTARDRSILAVGLNGQPLRIENGFPVRLLTPGSYGQWANVKWLERLEVTRFADAPDYWAQRGWPSTGWVRPGSQIDVPVRFAALPVGETIVAGVAWNPPAGVRSVEVSIDDEPWAAAELAAELAPAAWRQWRFRWSATPGRHRIRVRCDGQESRTRSAFPAGFGGYQTVRVDVGAADSPLRRGLSTWTDEMLTRARYVTRVPASWLGVTEHRPNPSSDKGFE
ncbi:molybdopterin-dependent oxidoreductase [Nocardia sp. NPDC006044]|uniref:molybdopterin-dependent oxidoreductase n=1 Tax=Nocardia sp. NPDC006044 TaxID=3364306 RepID=UPI003689E71B